MTRIPVCCLLVWFLTGFGPYVFCQSQFDAVHSLLQRLAQDRNNLAQVTEPKKLSEEKEHFAEETKSLPSRVQDLLTQGMLESLNNGSARSAIQLQTDLRAALRVESVGEDSKNAYVFSFGGGFKPSYFVAYNVTYCAICSSSWIGVIAQKENVYALADSLTDPLPNQNVDVTPLGNLGSGFPVFIASGTLWGDSHRRMNAIAYSVSNQQLKKIWSASDLAEGEIAVNGRVVVVKSYTTLRPPFVWRTEVYALAPEGLQLQSSSETPAE